MSAEQLMYFMAKAGTIGTREITRKILARSPGHRFDGNAITLDDDKDKLKWLFVILVTLAIMWLLWKRWKKSRNEKS